MTGPQDAVEAAPLGPGVASRRPSVGSDCRNRSGSRADPGMLQGLRHPGVPAELQPLPEEEEYVDLLLSHVNVRSNFEHVRTQCSGARSGAVAFSASARTCAGRRSRHPMTARPSPRSQGLSHRWDQSGTALTVRHRVVLGSHTDRDAEPEEVAHADRVGLRDVRSTSCCATIRD